MEPKPGREFGKRRPSVPVVARPGPPAKRSGHVALLLMGTFAVGGGAYALMPRDNCERSPNLSTPSLLQGSTDCAPRGSSSSGGGHGGGSSSRSGFYGGDSSAGPAGSSPSDSASSRVTRGGFGSLAHAFGFSGG
jgi:hypothetical protein